MCLILWDDVALTMDGPYLSISTPVFDATIELTGASRQLDRIGALATGQLRELVLLVGSIVAALVETPRALCLEMLFKEASEDLAGAASLTWPFGSGVQHPQFGSLVITSNRTLTLSASQFSLRMALKSPDTDLELLSQHHVAHLQELARLYGWLLAEVVEKPRALSQLSTIVCAAEEIIDLNFALYQNDRGELSNAGLLAVFMAYARRPITLDEVISPDGHEYP